MNRGDVISVVIRAVERGPPVLQLSEFSIIYFDDPDSYWLHTESGVFSEYFKRVR